MTAQPDGLTFSQRLKAKQQQPAPVPAQRPAAVIEGDNPRAQRWAQRKLEETCAQVSTEPEGGRNHALNAAAYSLGRLIPKWLEEWDTADRLALAAVAAGLSQVEARRTIQSGINAGRLDPRDPPVDDSDDGWAVFGVDTPTQRPAQRVDVTVEAEDPEQAAPNSWLPVDLAPYLDGSYTPPAPQLLTRTDAASLIYPGRVHWLSGEPEALKSWLALLTLAQAVLNGQRCAYIDLEDGAAGITGRLLAMGISPGHIRDLVLYIAPDQPLSYARRAELAPLLEGTALVVIDACTESLAMQQLKPKDDVDVASWLALLPRWAAKLGPAVLVLDHVVKDTETRGRWATGSQHKLAGLDGVAFTLEAVDPGGKGMRGRSRLYVSKDRHGQVRPHAVRTSGAKDWIGDLVVDSRNGLFADVTLTPPVGEQAEFRPTLLMERISEALERAGKPLSKTQIVERVKGRATEIRRALACLVDDEYVALEKGERGAELHVLVQSYPPVEEAS